MSCISSIFISNFTKSFMLSSADLVESLEDNFVEDEEGYTKWAYEAGLTPVIELATAYLMDLGKE